MCPPLLRPPAPHAKADSSLPKDPCKNSTTWDGALGPARSSGRYVVTDCEGPAPTLS